MYLISWLNHYYHAIKLNNHLNGLSGFQWHRNRSIIRVDINVFGGIIEGIRPPMIGELFGTIMA